MSIGARYWPTRFSRWKEPAAEAVPGYSLILPVPGDLPVFLELALEVCHQQDSEHRVETIVVPDLVTAPVKDLVERWSQSWDGPLSIVPFPQPEKAVLPRLQNPFRNYGVQFITGVNAARGTHVLMHDADLFMVDADFHRRHYDFALEHGLYACGVSEVWDSWFAEQGISLTATWELCVDKGWARSFPPFMHMGHDGELLGKRHTFDVTLLPQALTDPQRVGVGLGEDGIVHFNHVIGTYRRFTKSPEGFVDDRFRLLLIAIFIDLFARQPFEYAVPRLEDLAGGLHQPDAAVTFPSGEKASAYYAEFREKINGFLQLPWLAPDQVQGVRDALLVFDRHYEV